MITPRLSFRPSIAIKVSVLSLDTLMSERVDDDRQALQFEPSDGGRAVREIDGEDQYAFLLSCLTKRQREIIIPLSEGFSREEVAAQLGVSVQDIHQRVATMRERLRRKAHVPY